MRWTGLPDRSTDQVGKTLTRWTFRIFLFFFARGGGRGSLRRRGGGGLGIGFLLKIPGGGGRPGGAEGPGGLRRIGEFFLRGGTKYFIFGAEMSTKLSGVIRANRIG